MSNSRKFRRQLQKSPYVQNKIRANLRADLEIEARNRIIFGEENLISLLELYTNIEEYVRNKNKTQGTNSDASTAIGSATP